MTVEYIQHMGSDLTIVNAARVSYNKESAELSGKDRGLIGFLMRAGHASPFEHSALTVRVHTPIAVAREWQRHRTQSFSEVSTRYTEIAEPEFSFPEPRRQVGKPGEYAFEALEEGTAYQAGVRMSLAYERARNEYNGLLALGVAREVARNVLPLGMYTAFFATANLRNWLNFLSLRTAPQALQEIRSEAGEAEAIIARHWPVTHAAWAAAGRQQI